MTGVYFDDKLFNPTSMIDEAERFHLENTEANAFHKELTELMDMFSTEKAKINAVEAGISTEAVDVNRIKEIAKQILDKIIEYITKFCNGIKKTYNSVNMAGIVKRAKYARQLMDVKLNGKYSNTSMNPIRVYNLDPEYAKAVDAAIVKWASWNTSGVKTLPELEYQMHRATYLSFNALIIEASKHPKDDFPKNMGIEHIPSFIGAMGNLCDAFARMQPEDLTNSEYINTVIKGLNFKPVFLPVHDVNSLCAGLVSTYLTEGEFFSKDSLYLPNEKYIESIFDLQALSEKLAKVAENLKKIKAKVSTSDFQSAFTVDQQAQEIANVLSTITNVINTHITIIYKLDACYTSTAQLAKLFDNEYITEYVRKRNLSGKNSAELLASTEAYNTFECDDAGFYDLSYVDSVSSLESLEQSKAAAADVVFGLQQYKATIAACGISMRDVAAIESLVPGLLSNNMPVGGYTYERSTQNAEYAIEMISAHEVMAWVSLGTIIIQIAKKCYEWIQQRVSSYRIKRNIEAVRRYMERTKDKVRSKFAPANAGNVNDALKARQTNSAPNPTAQQRTVVKPYVVPDEPTDATIKLFRDVFKGKLGLPESASSDFVRAENIEQLFRVLNTHGIQGPAFFRADAVSHAFKLLTFIGGTVQALKQRLEDNREILKQIDGYISGNATPKLSFDTLISPFQELLGGATGDGNLREVAAEAQSYLSMWARPTELKHVSFLSNPANVSHVMDKLLKDFPEADSMRVMADYKGRYETLLREIKGRVERYSKVATDKAQLDELQKNLAAYQKDLEAVISVFNSAIILHSRMSDFCGSFANACTAFMETGK